MSAKKYSERRANKPNQSRFDSMREDAVPLPRSKAPLVRDRSLSPDGAEPPTRIRSYVQPNKNVNPYSNREPREAEKMVPEIVRSGVIHSRALQNAKDDLLHPGADRLSAVPDARTQVQPRRGLYQQVRKTSFNEPKNGADSTRRTTEVKSTIRREQPMPQRITHAGVSRVSNAENEPAPVPVAPYRQNGMMAHRDNRRPSMSESLAATSRKRSVVEDDVEEMKQEVPALKKERNAQMNSDNQARKKNAHVDERKKNETVTPQKMPENCIMKADNFEPEIASKCIASIGIRVNKTTKEKHPTLCGSSREIQLRIAKLRSNALRGIPIPKLQMPEPKKSCANNPVVDKVGEIQELLNRVSTSFRVPAPISEKLRKSAAADATSVGSASSSSSESTKPPAALEKRKWSKAPIPPPIRPRVARLPANGTAVNKVANNGSTSSKIDPANGTASKQNGILNGVKTSFGKETERSLGPPKERTSFEKFPKNEPGGSREYQQAQPSSVPKSRPLPSRQSDVAVKEEDSDSDDDIVFLAQITPQGKKVLRQNL